MREISMGGPSRLLPAEGFGQSSVAGNHVAGGLCALVAGEPDDRVRAVGAALDDVEIARAAN